MTRGELEGLVSQGEGKHIEFKRKLPSWPKLVRELVAFANSSGGRLFIGVGDDGELVGVADPRAITEAIALELHQYLRPQPEIEVEVVPLNWKKSIVVLRVGVGHEKPYFALTKPEGKEGNALIRIADASTTASKEVFQLLKFSSRPRNIRVEYGDKEIQLMEYLKTHDYITLKTYQQITGLPIQAVSRTLVHLVKGNVLRIEPGVEEDHYWQRL